MGIEQTKEFLKKIEQNITRVEIIDSLGRSYVNWNKDNNITLSLQDDEKTLKIFITPKKIVYSELFEIFEEIKTPNINHYIYKSEKGFFYSLNKLPSHKLYCIYSFSPINK